MGPAPSVSVWFLLHCGGGDLESWGHPGIKDTGYPPRLDWEVALLGQSVL